VTRHNWIPWIRLKQILRVLVTSHLTLKSRNKFLIFLNCPSFILFVNSVLITGPNRVDTQGLLDRVFPLPTNSSSSFALPNSQSPSQQQSYSFRTLLKESSRHPLRVLRVRYSQLALPPFTMTFSAVCSPALVPRLCSPAFQTFCTCGATTQILQPRPFSP